jgi:hypothetical protein
MPPGRARNGPSPDALYITGGRHETLRYSVERILLGKPCDFPDAVWIFPGSCLHELNRRDVITNLLIWISGILKKSS